MPMISTSSRRRNRIRLEKARFELQQAILERKRARDPSNTDIMRMERRIDSARMEIERIEKIIEITQRMDFLRKKWADDTVQSTGFDDCVGKMISHLSDAHPEMEHDQVVAAAHEKCREKHGGRKPKG